MNSYAAEYYAEPTITSLMKLDDNVRLTTLPHNTVGSAALEGQVEVGYAVEKTNITLTPAVKVSRYSEEVGLEQNDIFVDVSANHAVSTRLRLSFDAGLKDETIGTQEINVTGTTFNEVRKDTKSLSPSINYSINDKLNLSLSYAIQEVAYDDSPVVNLSSFDFQQLTLTSSYQFNEKNNITLQTYKTIFEVTDTDSKTVSHAVQLSLNHVFNETLTFSAGGGFILSNSEFNLSGISGPIRTEQSVSGSLFDFSINKSFETTNVNVGFSRNVFPGVTGDQDVRDSWSLNVQQRFNDRFNARLNVSFLDNTSQNQFNNTNNDFEFLQLNSSVNYLMNRNLNVELGYRYSRNENASVSAIPDSNSVFVNLRYDFDRVSFSR